MCNLAKRFCVWFLCICMILSFTPTISYATNDDTKTPEAKSMSIDKREAAQPIAVKKYAHTVGTDIYISDEKYIMKGVVASNAVAASPAAYDIDMMTEEDYKEIAGLGFNTVRFLFNYNILEDDSNPYTYKQSGWDWFDLNLEWAKKHGIHLILDCHLSQGGIPSTGGNQNVWTQGEANQERLVAMWGAIADRYKENDTIAGYGLLNEPFIENGDAKAWDDLLSRLVTTIRAVDSNHMLVIQRAQIGNDRKYVEPVVNDNNWILEVHCYPGETMKFVNKYFSIPDDFFYYGNNNIIGYRDATASTESNKPSNTITKSFSTDWTDYSFDFAAGDSNNAYLLFEITNLGENENISIKDISVTCDGKEVYNMKYNLDSNYTSYVGDNPCIITYNSKDNYINISGKAGYASFADNGNFRYFGIESGKTYTVSFKAKSETGVSDLAALKVTAKEYKTENLYTLNKDYTEKLLDYGELTAKYNVPLFYGEIGVQRNAYNENRNITSLSSDILNWLTSNSCNYTWFSWHEPNYGIYTSSGLDPKSNPNNELLKQIADVVSETSKNTEESDEVTKVPVTNPDEQNDPIIPVTDSDEQNVPVIPATGPNEQNVPVIPATGPVEQNVLKTQTITTAKIKTYRVKNLKRKKAVFSLKAKTTGNGKLTYKVIKGKSKYITVSKKGKVTLKKGCRKGTYKIRITAAKTSTYPKATKVISIKVK